MPLLYHAYVYLEFLILACTIYILAPLQFEDGVQTFSTETGSKVYYGTLSDYLSQSGDYKLYSISLAAGDYL